MKKIPPYNKTCPKCNNPCAFEGFNHIQCPNDSCANYTELQATIVTEWKREQIKIEESYSQPINGSNISDDEEQHEEIARSLKRLYQGYYSPTISTNNSSTIPAPMPKDASIDNFALPSQPDPSDQYYDDDGDYSYTDSINYDEFDAY